MAETATHVFRASLRPRLYREIEIASAKSLNDLAEAIVASFDFDLDHAFGFYSKVTGNIYDSPVRYELFVDFGEAGDGARSVKRTRIDSAFPAVGAKMRFLFDYGDEWVFTVELIAVAKKEKGARYPRVLKSVGEAPDQYPDMDEDE